MRPDLHQTPILRQSAHELGYAEAGQVSGPENLLGNYLKVFRTPP